MKKIGFLFGAGAEFAFNMPSGGQFALDIFRCDASDAKKAFQHMRDNIDLKDQSYAGDWLPSEFTKKRIGVFGKSVCESIIQDTLHQKRSTIIEELTHLDTVIENILNKLSEQGLYSKEKFAEDIKEITSSPISKNYLKHVIKFNGHLSEANNIFDNRYFNSIISVYNHGHSSDNFKSELKTIIISIFQLLIGAIGEELTNNLNENIITIEGDEDFDLFDDIGNIFYLDYKSIGLTGLTYLFDFKKPSLTTSHERIVYLSQLILEEIYSSILDYKSLIDSYWRYLYCPKVEWAKFCKISIFLISVKNYIDKYYNEIKSDTCMIDCYYSDVKQSIENSAIDLPNVFTTNYTPLITDYLGSENVVFLNGSTSELYDPYLNKIVNSPDSHFAVPLLFTQSGTKPMTSITMLQRYVKFYENLRDSDIICSIGFGFNLDDEHINGIIRSLLNDDKKQMIVIEPASSTKDEESIAKALKVSDSSQIKILKVDSARKCIDTKKLWIEEIASS